MLDQGAQSGFPLSFSKFSHAIVLVFCPRAFRPRILAKNACRRPGARHFPWKFIRNNCSSHMSKCISTGARHPPLHFLHGHPQGPHPPPHPPRPLPSPFFPLIIITVIILTFRHYHTVSSHTHAHCLRSLAGVVLTLYGFGLAWALVPILHPQMI